VRADVIDLPYGRTAMPRLGAGRGEGGWGEGDEQGSEELVGLDIGTSKIVAIVAELTPEGRWRSSASGSHQESRGLKKGVVVNIEATVNAIQRASSRKSS
jgi:cell division protein FtsA